MEHCKKLVLVPHETITRMHEKPVSRTSGDVLSELDTDMKHILARKADDSEKWKMYEQTLQRYLHFAKEQRQPVSLSITTEQQNDETTSNHAVLRERLAGMIPATLKKSATSLFDLLTSTRTSPPISLDSSGQVKIGDSLIPASNIIDLVCDAVRPRKSARATGWENFASHLKKINTPLELIRNESYIRYIQNQQGSGARHDSSEGSTPPRRPARGRGPQRRQSHGWERWS